MKLTKSKLNQIIKEELETLIYERAVDPSTGRPAHKGSGYPGEWEKTEMHLFPEDDPETFTTEARPGRAAEPAAVRGRYRAGPEKPPDIAGTVDPSYPKNMDPFRRQSIAPIGQTLEGEPLYGDEPPPPPRRRKYARIPMHAGPRHPSGRPVSPLSAADPGPVYRMSPAYWEKLRRQYRERSTMFD